MGRTCGGTRPRWTRIACDRNCSWGWARYLNTPVVERNWTNLRAEATSTNDLCDTPRESGNSFSRPARCQYDVDENDFRDRRNWPSRYCSLCRTGLAVTTAVAP